MIHSVSYVDLHMDRAIHNSILKLILYGPRFRINQSYPGNIGNGGLQHSLESWKYCKSQFGLGICRDARGSTTRRTRPLGTPRRTTHDEHARLKLGLGLEAGLDALAVERPRSNPAWCLARRTTRDEMRRRGP